MWVLDWVGVSVDLSLCLTMLRVCVCAVACARVCEFLSVGVCQYSRGVWSLHLLRTSESVKSTDCPNRSHWDSNPRLSCAWASLERQEREARDACVRARGREGGSEKEGTRERHAEWLEWISLDEWWRRREEIGVSAWAKEEGDREGNPEVRMFIVFVRSLTFEPFYFTWKQVSSGLGLGGKMIIVFWRSFYRGCLYFSFLFPLRGHKHVFPSNPIYGIFLSHTN